jgi:class 3 adenylate cyclase/thioredoxin-like negative regulator of GroEL
MERKLTTIFCTDVVGYSRMMSADEEGTLQILAECRSIIDPMIEEYRGRIFNSAGDSVLAEFASPVNAVKFSIACQQSLYERNRRNPKHPQMRFRIGLNLGDVVVQGTNLMGDAVNLAARIESQADYGGISMSDVVYQAVAGKILDAKFVDRGLQSFKNIPEPLKIWSVAVAGAEPNPSATQIDSDKSVAKFVAPSIDEESSTEDVIKYLMADVANASISMPTAQKFISSGDYEHALPILLARTVRNREHSTFEILIELAERQVIPKRYIRKIAAVFQAGNKMLMNPRRQTAVGNMFASGYLGENRRNISLQIWRNCADKDLEAKVNLGTALLALPDATKNETAEGVAALLEAGKQKNAQAAIELAKYYDGVNDNSHAFQWYWIARWLKDPAAQTGLEKIATRISKPEFGIFKVNAEALVEEIDWNSRNNIL